MGANLAMLPGSALALIPQSSHPSSSPGARNFSLPSPSHSLLPPWIQGILVPKSSLPLCCRQHSLPTLEAFLPTESWAEAGPGARSRWRPGPGSYEAPLGPVVPLPVSCHAEAPRPRRAQAASQGQGLGLPQLRPGSAPPSSGPWLRGLWGPFPFSPNCSDAHTIGFGFMKTQGCGSESRVLYLQGSPF